MTFSRPRHGDAVTRHGVLLLLVLSVLALFVVIGAVGILLAIRAREAARAFAAATSDQAGSAALARTKLDEALLKLIRGPSSPLASGTDVTESLLEDKYGTPDTCTITAISGTASGFFSGATGTVTVSGLNLSNPAAVAGRVLTFVPRPEDPTGPTSYRILRVNSAGNTLVLANVRPSTPLPLPSTLSCEAVVNGREFAGTQATDKNEAYDAFDEPTEPSPRNPFLTWPDLTGSIVTGVRRAAFQAQGSAALTVDNDGDGVVDGIWLTGVLPAQRTAEGDELKFDVSYLVLDLDGRLNLNAHGSFVRALTASSTSTYPRDPRTFPVGLGYGPADVDASLLVSSTAEVTSGTIPAQWVRLLRGGTVTTVSDTSTTTQWRPRPRIENTQAGRYGITTAATTNNGSPGGQTATGLNPLHSDFWVSGTTGGFARSPTDLKGRLQAFTDGTPPTLRFARPAVAWANPDVEDVSPSATSGTAVHPYRMRLDEDAPRGGPYQTIAALPADSVFTPAELERILRQFDADAALLAPRLAALLDDRAQASRMTVTTDSWDTPAITGTAAERLRSSVTGGDPYAVHSPEVVAGLRFNLNRPVLTTTAGAAPAARQEYFRHLYTLLVALGTPASDAAQWAANVIEFRDPDSIMSWYPYDTNPLDGSWDVPTADPPAVWGVERPEMVITSASNVGTNQMRVVLYRPWAARLSTGTAAVSGTTERIDASLGNPTTNALNAALTASGSAVWCLSVGGSTTGLNTLLATATAVATNTTAGTATLTVSGGPTQVILQRLADPGKAFGAALDTGGGSNRYIDVHVATVGTTATVSRWLHWPNRDMVSHAELLAVQSGSAADLVQVLFDTNGTRERSLARDFPSIFPIILDATIVPSRFVGAHVSVANGASTLAGTGYENFQHSQFSRWREAGRVNVNTILPNAGHPANLAHLDNAVWNALLGRPGTANPVTASGYVPITADSGLVMSGNDAFLLRSGTDADFRSAFLRRSTAIRLANVATVRSHVFAVWITLRITNQTRSDAPQYARLFAIVDRSIPVAAAPGRTLNVRETIRLQRFLP